MKPSGVKSFRVTSREIRKHSDLPLAVGFGVRTIDDLNALQGKAEVAAFCSQYIEWQRDSGSDDAARRMKDLIGTMNAG